MLRTVDPCVSVLIYVNDKSCLVVFMRVLKVRAFKGAGVSAARLALVIAAGRIVPQPRPARPVAPGTVLDLGLGRPASVSCSPPLPHEYWGGRRLECSLVQASTKYWLLVALILLLVYCKLSSYGLVCTCIWNWYLIYLLVTCFGVRHLFE